MTADPAAACPCGSHSVYWEAGGKLLCARCAANVVVASGSFVTPAAAPPRTSCCQHSSDCAQHNAPAEPVGPCDCGKGGPPCGGEPVPPPEWAVNIALEEFDKDLIDLGFVDRLARLLASVREAAIRQAADTVCAMPVPVAFLQHGIMGVARMAAADRILSLIDSPPKEAP